jgi:hypothetical protein
VSIFLFEKSSIVPKDKAAHSKLDLTACKQVKLNRQAYWRIFNRTSNWKHYRHKVRPNSLEIRSRVGANWQIKSKLQIRMTVRLSGISL